MVRTRLLCLRRREGESAVLQFPFREADLDETREQLRTLIKAYTNGEQREQRTEPQAV
jgi:hypothetical protein